VKFERLHQPLLPFPEFRRRMLRYTLGALALVAASLGIGTVGYHVIGGLPWVDSVLNASMILTGMGPVDPMRTTAAKLFASLYAIFSGVAFLSIVGVLVAPIVHRMLVRFHLDMDQEKS
jgi:hypothetical protein